MDKSKKWYVKNPALLRELNEIIQKEYPTLHVQVENSIVYLRGSFFIRTIDKTCVIDRYSIEIQLPNDYPRSVPIVRETEGRLPKIPDRHFVTVQRPDSIDNIACLFLRDERYKYYPNGASIIEFIDGPVQDFFLWQTYYDLTNGKSSLGERRHGVKGVVEFYSEELQTSEIRVIVQFLEYLSKEEVKGHWPCYCGSRNIMRKCHFEKLLSLKSKITPEVAQVSLIQIRNEISRT